MQQKKIIFRVPSKKIKALDSLAGTRRLSRTDILNEAIDEYLALNEQWKAQIREGIRQAEQARPSRTKRCFAASLP